MPGVVPFAEAPLVSRSMTMGYATRRSNVINGEDTVCIRRGYREATVQLAWAVRPVPPAMSILRAWVRVNERYLLMSGVERVGIARKSYPYVQTKTPHW